MERKDLTRARLGIAAIGKPGNDAGALIDEGQRFLVVNPFELGGGIAAGLLLDCRDLVAQFFGLGLDHADGFFINKESIIRRPNIGLVFLDRDAASCAEIDGLVALNDPTRLRQRRSIWSRAICSGVWFVSAISSYSGKKSLIFQSIEIFGFRTA